MSTENKPYHHLSNGTFRNPEGSPERNMNFKWSFKVFNKEKKKLDMTVPEEHVVKKEKVLSDLAKFKKKRKILEDLQKETIKGNKFLKRYTKRGIKVFNTDNLLVLVDNVDRTENMDKLSRIQALEKTFEREASFPVTFNNLNSLMSNNSKNTKKKVRKGRKSKKRSQSL